MNLLEVEHSVETVDWTPSINIRPHHVFDIEVRGAILGKRLLAFNPDGDQLFKNHPDDFVRYMADTYGYGASTKDLLQTFRDHVASLDDNSIVHLDIEKDDVCKACPVGKHCDATNTTFFGQTWNRAEREKESLDTIHEKLLVAGFSEGVDFTFQETPYELFNYDGENLWKHTNSPTPEIVTFNSMLVKMSALREVI